MPKKKKLLVFGLNLRAYTRNRNLLLALETVYDLEEVQITEGVLGQLFFFTSLLRRGRFAHAILLLQPSMRFAPLTLCARMFIKAPIIGDAFISIYDTFVSDRALARGKSLKGVYYHLLDALYVRACDALFFDTPEHEAYFLRTCRIPPRVKRFIVPVTIDTREVDATSGKYPEGIDPIPGKRTVIFYGGYIPLQGVTYIIDAIKLLSSRTDIRFIMIGSGQVYPMIRKRAKELELANVLFVERIPYAELLAALKMADVSLGIFGDTEKAQRVIPNKLLDSAAIGVPVVCGRTIPIERHFKDGEQIFFARLADPKDIALAIERALADKGNAARIALAARKVVEDNFSLASLKKNEIPNIQLWLDSFPSSRSQEKEATMSPRIVVYTAIFGAKDRLRLPLAKPTNVDFVCFTDQPLHSNVWQIRRVAPPIPGDPTRSNRHYKFFPNKYLPEYEYSIYIDGNMRLLSDPTPLLDLYLQDANIALFDHMGIMGGRRGTVAEEAKALLAIHEKGKSKETPDAILAQIEAYRKEGFPDNGGLISGMTILRRHNASDVIRAMEAWWEELTKRSRRDQLSFNYVAWKLKLRFTYIPGDSYNNSYFFRHTHERSQGVLGQLRTRLNEFLFVIGFC